MLFSFVRFEHNCDPPVSGSEVIAAVFVPGRALWWLQEVALLVAGLGAAASSVVSALMCMQEKQNLGHLGRLCTSIFILVWKVSCVKLEGKPPMSPSLSSSCFSCIAHKDELPMELSLTFPLCRAEALLVTLCWISILNLEGGSIMRVACHDLGAKLKTPVCTRTPVSATGYTSWDLTPMLFNQMEDPDQQLQLLQSTG